MICLMPNCAFLSETSRAIAIYEALVARGADACVVTHGGPYTRVLRDQGIPFDILGPGWTDARARAFVQSLPGIGPPDGTMYAPDELRSLVQAEARLFAERRVRAVVTGFTLTTLLSTRIADVPLVTEHAGSWVPPVAERGLLPAPLRPTLPFARYMPEALVRWLANKAPSRVRIYCGELNRLARELGVEGVPSFASLLLGDLTLVTDCPEVLGIPAEELESWTPRDPSRFRKDPRLRYVGPLFARLDVPIPERVERFLHGPRPVAYVAITSSPPELVRGVVAAVRAAGARVLVAGTVHALADLEDEDVLVESILPSHRIMPRVDIACIAGGQGSVQTAMASGVPFVGIPLQPEQDFNIVEMERHGAARRISQEDAVSPRMTAVVREVLADDRHRRAARRIAAIYAKADGPGACADAILELVVDPSARRARTRPRARGAASQSVS